MIRRCQRCEQIGDLRFGEPSLMGIQSVGGSRISPRARLRDDGTEELIFNANVAGMGTDIITATRNDNGWDQGVLVPGNAVNTTGQELAPIQLPPGATLPNVNLTEPILFTGMASGRRQIYMATSGSDTRANLPGVNQPADDSFSLAVAYTQSPARYWFMRRTGGAGAYRFVTQTAGSTVPVPVDDKLIVPGGCTVSLGQNTDIAPWVTPNGKYLLFQANYPAACNEDNKGLRAFYMQLNELNGEPTGEAKEIAIDDFSITAPVRTPSLSPDFCSLYFATEDISGVRDLYSAPRR